MTKIKCPHQDCDCRYPNHYSDMAPISCKDCELYNDGYRLKGCMAGTSTTAAGMIILIVVLLWLFCSDANAQYTNRYTQTREYYKNAIYSVYQPNDNAFGLSYDHSFNTKIFYTAFTYGNYNECNINHIDHHYKLVVGYVFQLYRYYNDDVFFTVPIGLTGHYYDGIYDKDKYSTMTLFPVSAEIGLGIAISWLSIVVRIDPFKRESSVKLGIIIN